MLTEASTELILNKTYEILQKLIGLHGQLNEVCRMEREAFVSADLKLIQEYTQSKELIIETIKQQEMNRIRFSAQLAVQWKLSLESMTLTRISQEIESTNPKMAELFRSALTTLKILIDRTKALNDSNRVFLEKSLEHVRVMKNNVLGEAVPQAETYSSYGQKVSNVTGARLISKEA